MSASPLSPPSPLPSLTSLISTERRQVHLPPHLISDFVIHYLNTDYHVHKFVLHHHSAYFRSYFDASTPSAEMPPPSEEKERDSNSCPPALKKHKAAVPSPCSSSPSPTAPCTHPSIVQCIHIHKHSDIERTNSDTFLLFLRHLYFSSTLHSPPFWPNATIESQLNDDTPINFAFPTSPPSALSIRRYAKMPSIFWTFLTLSPLLSLFHYFDCRSVLQRCDEVITTWMDDLVLDDMSRYYVWGLLWEVSHYGMKGAERACIEHVACGGEVEGDWEVRAVWGALSADVQFRVMSAMSTRLAKKGREER